MLSGKDATAYELGWVLGGWVINFFVALIGLFISLFLMISHEDLEHGYIEPIELSNGLQQYLPYEYLCSAVFVVIAFLIGSPWYILLLPVPLAIYNLKKYIKKDHKVYFITKREY